MPRIIPVVVTKASKGISFWRTFMDATHTIREVGLFNDDTTGIMLIRSVFYKDFTMDTNKIYRITIELKVEDL